jgi:exodeoxyribonuclease V beta subunit
VTSLENALENATAFDPAGAALAGINLIEANAGTGKTWAITALYVRLLLETDCTVDSVLVVTFTESAAGELRDRVRERLTDTRAAFERGTPAPDDDFTRALMERAANRDEALLKLTAALSDFDEAPIYTIHAFCQRVLSDRAFEAGLPFRTEIVPDQSAILKEIVEDFWRKEVHDASPLFARFLAKQRVGPYELLDQDVERALSKPYLSIRGPHEPADRPGLEREFIESCAAARAIWMAERDAIRRTLLDSTGLHRGRYKKDDVPGWLDQMHSCLSPESPPLDLCKPFDRFTSEALRKATNKNAVIPQHPFFDACERLKAAHTALADAFEARLVRMRMRLIEYCDRELAVRKERRALQSYDDLLLNLSKALHAVDGNVLAEKLRQRYKAALIDEFQDTDPLQYDIFHRIYASSDCPVFLVGDPKQAIYSFRGADVYTYIAARPDARAKHTLGVNWRSSASLLAAVNRIFDGVPNPFAIREIGFQPSRPAPGDRGRLVIDGDAGAPFRIWLLETESAKALTKTEARPAATDATADEIVRLLELAERGAARIEDRSGPRRLLGGDIAVLVRTHYQGTAMREALAKRGVASVQRGSRSVFATAEAEELERLLAAIAEPGREPLVAAALATALLGHSGEDVHALQADERRWEDTLEDFREAHREWHENGFVRMLRGFIDRHDILVRLLEYRDGERRATNLLHLIELLHCDAERQGIGGLLAWLAAKRDAPAEANEPELLRLESDENLVKILTVHVAKGLEFPIVFCPFVWDSNLRMASAKTHVIRFHDRANANAAVVDFGSADFAASRPEAVLDEHGENLRLLYVALTRARYRVWMVWGNVKDAALAAPAWLLHRDAEQSASSAGPAGARDLDEARIRPDLDRLASRAEGAIEALPLPRSAEVRYTAAHETGSPFSARPFARVLRDTRSLTSFTALAHGRTVESPDYDAADTEALPESVSARDIFAFPRGAQAGKCIHAIFEDVEFVSLERRELDRIVSIQLATHGFDGAWTRAIGDMVQSVIDTPLDESGMRLRGIGRERRLDELEFYYPIATLSDAGLRAILAGGGFPDAIRERIGALTFAPAQGYMRGFIDLVFEHDGRYYLADYKSNWLGASAAAYDQPALGLAIAREAYYLQYLVYCVALQRYLRRRIPGYRYDRHFGGVRYLFVRGMKPELGATCGVYADRPSREFIETLDRYLRGGQCGGLTI